MTIGYINVKRSAEESAQEKKMKKMTWMIIVMAFAALVALTACSDPGSSSSATSYGDVAGAYSTKDNPDDVWYHVFYDDGSGCLVSSDLSQKYYPFSYDIKGDTLTTYSVFWTNVGNETAIDSAKYALKKTGNTYSFSINIADAGEPENIVTYQAVADFSLENRVVLTDSVTVNPWVSLLDSQHPLVLKSDHSADYFGGTASWEYMPGNQGVEVRMYMETLYLWASTTGNDICLKEYGLGGYAQFDIDYKTAIQSMYIDYSDASSSVKPYLMLWKNGVAEYGEIETATNTTTRSCTAGYEYDLYTKEVTLTYNYNWPNRSQDNVRTYTITKVEGQYVLTNMDDPEDVFTAVDEPVVSHISFTSQSDVYGTWIGNYGDTLTISNDGKVVENSSTETLSFMFNNNGWDYYILYISSGDYTSGYTVKYELTYTSTLMLQDKFTGEQFYKQ